MQFLVFIIIQFLRIKHHKQQANNTRLQSVKIRLNLTVIFKMIKPQNKKMSQEFIAYLKNTPEIPPKKKQKQPIDAHSQQSHKHQSGIIQGDFSKISCSYVLQNERLRKKSIIYNNKHKNHQFQQESMQGGIVVEDIQMIKKIAKLEYLQKKGYLKPQQKQILNKLRGNNNNNNQKRQENMPIQYSQNSMNYCQNKQNEQYFENLPVQKGKINMNYQNMPYCYSSSQIKSQAPRYGTQNCFDAYYKKQPQNYSNYHHQYDENQNYNQQKMMPNHNFVYGSQTQLQNQFMGYKFN